MFNNDAEIVSQALIMWANYIQTGSVGLNRNDLINQGRHKEIKALSSEQEKLVQKLQEMSIKALNADIQLSEGAEKNEDKETVNRFRTLPTPKPRLGPGGNIF